MVKCLGPHTFTTVGVGLIPAWGTNILQALWRSQKNKNFFVYIYTHIYTHTYIHIHICICIERSRSVVSNSAPSSMGFSRQEYWSGLPFPSPVDHPNPGIKPGSPTLQADSLPSEPPGNPSVCVCVCVCVMYNI